MNKFKKGAMLIILGTLILLSLIVLFILSIDPFGIHKLFAPVAVLILVLLLKRSESND